LCHILEAETAQKGQKKSGNARTLPEIQTGHKAGKEVKT